MAIHVSGKVKLHWNYFLALENDLAKTSRYIEFHEDNLQVFSIELAYLLFAAAPEVDVILTENQQGARSAPGGAKWLDNACSEEKIMGNCRP